MACCAGLASCAGWATVEVHAWPVPFDHAFVERNRCLRQIVVDLCQDRNVRLRTEKLVTLQRRDVLLGDAVGQQAKLRPDRK